MTSRNVLITALLCSFVIFISCNNDDNGVEIKPTPEAKEEPEEVAANKPPADFKLIGVTDKAVKVAVHPTFSWEASQDPEGDTILYDLYLDANESPRTLYAADLTDTRFEVTERLYVNEKYSWKVIAKDATGETFESKIFSFDTRGLRVRRLNEHADFRPRWKHTSVVFDNRLWVIGGTDDRQRKNNDVWATTDGLQWSEATLNYQPPFSSRDSHTSVVFDDKIWIITGDTSNNDIWASENGLTWTEISASAPFLYRINHTSVNFDQRLWVIGGRDVSGGTSTIHNDVWYSNDGPTWTKVPSETPFSERELHASIVFDNKIWVIGGRDGAIGRQNDVWYSSDGISWSQAISKAPFSGRALHTTVVFDNKIWVIAGSIAGNNNENDIWYSADGIEWIEATLENSLPRRSGHTSAVFNNKIWFVGGQESENNGEITSLHNDIWTLD